MGKYEDSFYWLYMELFFIREAVLEKLKIPSYLEENTVVFVARNIHVTHLSRDFQQIASFRAAVILESLVQPRAFRLSSSGTVDFFW